MDRYHLRRTDKELGDVDELAVILETTRYISLALCCDEQPYVVALNHGYDRQRRCLYFHCAPSGKKIDFMLNNPRCWGMAVEDHGYVDGACDHAYRSVMFGGRITLLTDDGDKRRALEVMIRQQESDPERVMSEQLTPARVAAVTIGRIDVEVLTGKAGLPG